VQNLISLFVLQHLGFLFLGILTLARVSSAVTASPSEKLWEEIGNVKTMMAAVSGKTVFGRKQNLLLYKNYCLLSCDAVHFNR
jgi:ABC-type transporter Mla maintaining outer membrane lipid asymmetry permease subunit MlaE